jgi:hypothetical protein
MYQAREFLAELHLAVVRLPDADFDGSERKDAVTYDEWKKVLERFSNLPLVQRQRSFWAFRTSPCSSEFIRVARQRE